MAFRTWYENERDYHADLARWWLTRAVDRCPYGGKWDGAEAGYHASQAAHYHRLQGVYLRKVAFMRHGLHFPDGYVHDLSQSAIDILREEIPDTLLNGLDAYVRDRLRTGDFLKAVLENDLNEAYCRADTRSRDALPALVRYFNNCLPAPAWGSPEKVAAWLLDEDRHSGE